MGKGSDLTPSHPTPGDLKGIGDRPLKKGPDRGRVQERMYRFPLGGVHRWTVRLWCKLSISREEARELVNKLYKQADEPRDLADDIADAEPDRVNAVEVLDTSGDGDLAYNDWP